VRIKKQTTTNIQYSTNQGETMRNNLLPAVHKRLAQFNFENFFAGFNSSVDESVLPLHIAKRIYNFNISDGTLSDGYGMARDSRFPIAATNIWNYRFWHEESKSHRNILMASHTNGEIRFLPHGERNLTRLVGVQFTSTPIAVNYRLFGEDVILMTSETDGMFVWNGRDAAYKIEGAPSIRTLTMHFERMFVTTAGEANAVYFSDDLDPTNWGMELNEGGFIQFMDEMGSSNKVISFLNHVYVFRDYGISRITAFGDQSEFSATNLFTSSGRIYGKTPTACGDRIMFLASDGIYMFDGISTIPVAGHLKGLIKHSPNAVATYHDGKYFLSLNLDIGTPSADNRNNSFISIDLKSGLVNVTHGIGPTAFNSIDGNLFAISHGTIGTINNSARNAGDIALRKSYVSPLIDLGTDEIKTIREFYIDSTVPFQLTLFSETTSRTLSVTPRVGITRLRMNFRGRKLGFAIETTATGGRLTRPGVRFSI